MTICSVCVLAAEEYIRGNRDAGFVYAQNSVPCIDGGLLIRLLHPRTWSDGIWQCSNSWETGCGLLRKRTPLRKAFSTLRDLASDQLTGILQHERSWGDAHLTSTSSRMVKTKNSKSVFFQPTMTPGSCEREAFDGQKTLTGPVPGGMMPINISIRTTHGASAAHVPRCLR